MASDDRQGSHLKWPNTNIIDRADKCQLEFGGIKQVKLIELMVTKSLLIADSY